MGLLFAFWLFVFFWPAVGLLFAIWFFFLFLFFARSELALCLHAFFVFGFVCLFNLLAFGLKLGLGNARRAHAL